MKKIVLALTAAVTVLTGCSATGSDDDRTQVVASFYPFEFVVDRVGASFVQTETLTSPGVEPHDVELTPKQVASVGEADVLVVQDGFQEAVDSAVEQADRTDGTTVDASTVVESLPASEEDHEDHEGEEEGHDDHDHGETDPHTWLDPQNMIAVTRAVETALADADPAHAADFTRNADELVAELEALDTAFTEGLATCERRTIVTSHAAFGYLATRFDLVQVPIAGLDPSNEPSPSELADITQLVRAEDITTIFTEELVSPAVARTVADETGADIATLDPIEGLGDDTTDETYLTLMRRNLEALRTANSCT